MKETSKLNEYRVKNNYNSYFNGSGIDIGCGEDLLSVNIFKSITNIIPYDINLDKNFNAMFCNEFQDNFFDFVYSSHCLEHMIDPYIAFKNWIRICKNGGYIIFSVPHEIFYEKYKWPSMFNNDHKTSWSYEFKSNLPKTINIIDFIKKFQQKVELIKCDTILENFDFNKFNEDQTNGLAICQIEIVVKKI